MPLPDSPHAAPVRWGTPSRVRIGRHPIHPLLVHFPIAFVVAGLGCDIGFLMTADAFWPRAAVWAIGAATILGAAAAIVGTLDFLLVTDIRRFVSSWNHFLIAVMLLSMTSVNWWLRVTAAEPAVLPWGLLLSTSSVVAASAAGWLGGKLVYEHNIGVAE